MLNYYVQTINCFFGLTLYITEITASTISTNTGKTYIYAHTFLREVFVIYAQFNTNQNMFTHFCRNPHMKFH